MSWINWIRTCEAVSINWRTRLASGLKPIIKVAWRTKTCVVDWCSMKTGLTYRTGGLTIWKSTVIARIVTRRTRSRISWVKIIVRCTSILTKIRSNIEINIRRRTAPCFYIKKSWPYVILSSCSWRIRTWKWYIKINCIWKSTHVSVKIPIVIQSTWTIGCAKVCQS